VQTKVCLVLAFVVANVGFSGRASTIVGDWVPRFRGVDFSVSTNTPTGGGFANRQVVYALRVDLTDPDIRLFPTPRIADYVVGVREVGGMTVSDFLTTYGLQAAINANFFGPGEYYLPRGTPMDVYGLQICEGIEVSPQDEPAHAAALVFDASNHAAIIPKNWPATNTSGIHTAVAGDIALLLDGKIMVSSRPGADTSPRTLFGLSKDRRFLYLVAIDGRQEGYSDGATDYESAEWLLLLGAYDGVNLDGGGSTTLVVQDTTGVPIRLNRPSAVADSGRERTVGSHFGLFAKLLPGFINDVSAAPEDTTAKITWTTVEPATSEVEYGISTRFGETSGLLLSLVTNHAVHLTGLTPGTRYYFRVISSTAAEEHTSSNFCFVTTNYVTTNVLFGVTHSWRYATASVAGLDWTAVSFDDSAWGGPGPGLLWVDVRATGPKPSVGPRNTEMPADLAGGGYPYIAYYFRTHFMLTNLMQGSSLAFTGYIDDGAIFYLNGREFYRLRMPDEVTAETLASGYPCGGDATCADEFTVPFSSIPGLSIGDNVLAAEVHNYNARSPDITFGLSLSVIEPIVRSPRLEITSRDGKITLSWNGSGFGLQSASSLEGPWTDVPGGSETPYTVEASQTTQFYRLRK
jgi:hypothetical protein